MKRTFVTTVFTANPHFDVTINSLRSILTLLQPGNTGHSTATYFLTTFK